MKSLLVFAMTFAIMQGTAMADAKDKMPVTKETREKMAQVHEKMAACLRTDKEMKECHEEMKEACNEDQMCEKMMDHKKMKK